MIDTVLFDLDGTLLPMGLKEFIGAYFKGLTKAFTNLGLDAERAIKAVWDGTEAMVRNDGQKTNAERFWDHFLTALDLPRERFTELAKDLDRFYTSDDFDGIQFMLQREDPALSRRIVNAAKSKGFTVVLATNPVFPMVAAITRLKWLGLTPQEFALVTDYTSSRYCKPNTAYYREIFENIGKTPQQCLMVGNNTREDMCAQDLGSETYLVTDYLENEQNVDISQFRHGTLAELEGYLASLPSVKRAT